MYEDLDSEEAGASDTSLNSAQSESAWKEELRAQFETWLETIEEAPELSEEQAELAPDLMYFYEQLAASNAEVRKSNRRTVEAFGQWGDTLARFDQDLHRLREHFTRDLESQNSNALPASWSLALAEVLDRSQRICAAFATPPPSSWLGGTQPWRDAWTKQAQGLLIMTSHLQELLMKAGLTAIQTIGQRFDPTRMAAVSTELRPDLPQHTVLEELATGYTRDGQVIRIAQVKLSIHTPSQP